jgi:hypothetical protein
MPASIAARPQCRPAERVFARTAGSYAAGRLTRISAPPSSDLSIVRSPP